MHFSLFSYSEIFYDVPTNNVEVEIGTTEYCNGDLIYEDEIPAIIEEEVVETMDYSSDESNYRLMSCNVQELQPLEEVHDIQHFIELKHNFMTQSLTTNQSLLKTNRKLFKDDTPLLTDNIQIDANRIATQCAKFRATIKIKKSDELLKMIRRKWLKKGNRGKRKKSDKKSNIETLVDAQENVIELGDVVS